jgi:hypothetical protein
MVEARWRRRPTQSQRSRRCGRGRLGQIQPQGQVAWPPAASSRHGARPGCPGLLGALPPQYCGRLGWRRHGGRDGRAGSGLSGAGRRGHQLVAKLFELAATRSSARGNGRTRWATSGPLRRTPPIDRTGWLAPIHNGIIENHASCGSNWRPGAPLTSATDTRCWPPDRTEMADGGGAGPEAAPKPRGGVSFRCRWDGCRRPSGRPVVHAARPRPERRHGLLGLDTSPQRSGTPDAFFLVLADDGWLSSGRAGVRRSTAHWSARAADDHLDLEAAQRVATRLHVRRSN